GEAALLAVAVDVASGAALGPVAVVPAHPAMKAARTVVAMSRIADMITEFERVRGKTSLKTYHHLVQSTRSSVVSILTAVAVLILIVVFGLGLLYAFRAFSP
ncbi:MAG: hypothetical protein M3T56_13880, partial [Chloroflexota bacterium]|nr:hypothetical protein [Chloroflexota bacterium]